MTIISLLKLYYIKEKADEGLMELRPVSSDQSKKKLKTF